MSDAAACLNAVRESCTSGDVSAFDIRHAGHFEVIVPSTSTRPLVLEELDKLAHEMSRRAHG